MNLPNRITLSRIFLIPVFIVVFFLDVIPHGYNYIAAAAVFAVASFTDFLDGHIARKRGLVTNLGKFLDPIADKVLVSTALILMLVRGAEIFQVPMGTPLLNMDEVDYDIDGRPVFCSNEYFVDGIFRHTVMRKKL